MEAWRHACLCFEPPPQAEKRPGSQAAEPRMVPEPRLCCAACGHVIARPDDRMSMNGAEAHTFRNPHGLEFRIGCFRRAAGCRAVGPRTPDHTWFAGYTWRVAVCAACRAHLGWLFEGEGGAFYGLILDRLVSATRRAG